MMRPCTLCNAQTSTPFNFLLSCVRCRAFFHHRCHKPPVSDKELINIIKHYNLQKQGGNRNPSFIWTCRSCAAQPPAAPPATSVPPAAPPAHNPPSSREHPIVLLDSDDDSPPPIHPQPLKSRKTVSKPNSIPSLLPPPQSTSRSKDVHVPTSVITPSPTVPNAHTVQTRRDSGIRIIDDPFIEPPPSVASPPLRPPLRAHSSAASSTSAVLSAELGGLHMSTPESVPQPPQEENEWDLEYLTPPARLSVPLPPANASAQSQPQVRIAQSLPPIAAIVSRDDDHYQEQDDDDEDEIEMDEIDATPAPTLARPVLLPVWIKQHFNPPPASSTSRKPFSRKKSKSQSLTAFTTAANSTSRHHTPPHLAPFFLFADQWIQDKKRTLPEYPSGVH